MMLYLPVVLLAGLSSTAAVAIDSSAADGVSLISSRAGVAAPAAALDLGDSATKNKFWRRNVTGQPPTGSDATLLQTPAADAILPPSAGTSLTPDTEPAAIIATADVPATSAAAGDAQVAVAATKPLEVFEDALTAKVDPISAPASAPVVAASQPVEAAKPATKADRRAFVAKAADDEVIVKEKVQAEALAKEEAAKVALTLKQNAERDSLTTVSAREASHAASLKEVETAKKDHETARADQVKTAEGIETVVATALASLNNATDKHTVAKQSALEKTTQLESATEALKNARQNGSGSAAASARINHDHAKAHNTSAAVEVVRTQSLVDSANTELEKISTSEATPEEKEHIALILVTSEALAAAEQKAQAALADVTGAKKNAADILAEVKTHNATVLHTHAMLEAAQAAVAEAKQKALLARHAVTAGAKSETSRSAAQAARAAADHSKVQHTKLRGERDAHAIKVNAADGAWKDAVAAAAKSRKIHDANVLALATPQTVVVTAADNAAIQPIVAVVTAPVPTGGNVSPPSEPNTVAATGTPPVVNSVQAEPIVATVGVPLAGQAAASQVQKGEQTGSSQSGDTQVNHVAAPNLAGAPTTKVETSPVPVVSSTNGASSTLVKRADGDVIVQTAPGAIVSDAKPVESQATVVVVKPTVAQTGADLATADALVLSAREKYDALSAETNDHEARLRRAEMQMDFDDKAAKISEDEAERDEKASGAADVALRAFVASEIIPYPSEGDDKMDKAALELAHTEVVNEHVRDVIAHQAAKTRAGTADANLKATAQAVFAAEKELKTAQDDLPPATGEGANVATPEQTERINKAEVALTNAREAYAQALRDVHASDAALARAEKKTEHTQERADQLLRASRQQERSQETALAGSPDAGSARMASSAADDASVSTAAAPSTGSAPASTDAASSAVAAAPSSDAAAPATGAAPAPADGSATSAQDASTDDLAAQDGGDAGQNASATSSDEESDSTEGWSSGSSGEQDGRFDWSNAGDGSSDWTADGGISGNGGSAKAAADVQPAVVQAPLTTPAVAAAAPTTSAAAIPPFKPSAAVEDVVESAASTAFSASRIYVVAALVISIFAL